ncbi:hypothetical protein BDZ89DRAFT_1062732, partial [Hymenopellis radicata]
MFNWQRRSKPVRKLDLLRMVESRAPAIIDVDLEVVEEEVGRALKAVTFRGFEEDETGGEAEEVVKRLRRVPKFKMVIGACVVRGP